MEWTDLIGKGLETYSKIEQGKIDARLAASREQAYAYEQAARSAAQNAPTSSTPAWVLPAVGFAVLGIVVYMVAK